MGRYHRPFWRPHTSPGHSLWREYLDWYRKQLFDGRSRGCLGRRSQRLRLAYGNLCGGGSVWPLHSNRVEGHYQARLWQSNGRGWQRLRRLQLRPGWQYNGTTPVRPVRRDDGIGTVSLWRSESVRRRLWFNLCRPGVCLVGCNFFSLCVFSCGDFPLRCSTARECYSATWQKQPLLYSSIALK
jgi:hypothetical protein